jgi:hypothetical protein
VLVTGALVAAIIAVTTPFAYAMLDGTVAPTPLQGCGRWRGWRCPAGVLLGCCARGLACHARRAVERLTRRPAPVGLRDALADALGDPSLEVGYWVPESGDWRDADGRPLASRTGPRATTELVRDGRPQALLVFDPACSRTTTRWRRCAPRPAWRSTRNGCRPALHTSSPTCGPRRRGSWTRRRRPPAHRVRAARRTAALLLDLGTTLTMVDAALPRGRREDLAPLVHAATDLSHRVREELRWLAAGVFPEALAVGGLPAALRELAAVSPLPVALELDVEAALPEPVAAAAWFACREALANAAKHAGASEVTIRVRAAGGELAVEVHDDGAGGADAAGSGLRGLADRMAAQGGRLEVRSPRGHGTTLRALLPLGVPA